jgi:hypothetical protein
MVNAQSEASAATEKDVSRETSGEQKFSTLLRIRFRFVR